MAQPLKLLLLLVSSVLATDKVYDGYKVYDIKPKSEGDLIFLRNLDTFEGDARSLDFLSFHNNLNDNVRLMVKPDEQNYIENLLKTKKVEYQVVTDNVQDKIDQELEEFERLATRKSSEVITFDRYYQHGDINKHLDNLATEYKSTVTVKTAGKSFEGREIKTITITNGDGREKNSIFVDAGIHAREWIAPATALYLINQLVDPQSNFSKLLNELDFVIQPVVNPDGYEFTFNRYRMWRKTRSTNGLGCSGVDANRNYDFHWHEVGSSDSSCSEVYHGKSAFSEKESETSRDIMKGLSGNCKFFLTLHSYGNYLLYPWGYSKDLPGNWKDQEEVAKAGADAIKKATGTDYTVGSTSNTLYLASGSSIDYANSKSGADIPIAIVMELGGGGFFGFDLPASEIDKNVKESAVGILAMSETIARKFKI